MSCWQILKYLAEKFNETDIFSEDILSFFSKTQIDLNFMPNCHKGDSSKKGPSSSLKRQFVGVNQGGALVFSKDFCNMCSHKKVAAPSVNNAH